MPYTDSNNSNLENRLDKVFDNRYDVFWQNLAHAHEEAAKQDLYIVEPDPDFSEEDLDIAWDKYMSMTKPFRRKADWIMLQYIGMDNTEIYNAMKSRMFRVYSRFANVIDGDVGYSGDPINLSEEATEGDELYYIPPSQRVEDLDSMLGQVDNLNQKMEEADDYFKQTGLIMIIPSKIENEADLEKAWDGYNMMIRRHQRMSDWKTTELFGLTNQQLYDAMKDRFNSGRFTQRYAEYGMVPFDPVYKNLNNMIENYITKGIKSGDFTNRELAETLINVQTQDDPFYRMSGERIIDKAIDQFDGMTVNVPSASFDYTDMPMYTPNEMIDMGVAPLGDPEAGSEGPGTDVIPSIKWDNKGWFDEYSKLWQFGFAESAYSEKNLERVHELARLYIQPRRGDPVWEHSVRMCGWNPEADFKASTRSAVDFGINRRLREACTGTYNIIDVSDQPVIKEGIDVNIEEHPGLKPIYIVLVGGQAVFSKLIKTVTNSKYSHCTLSLDASMKRCYSYGTDPAVSLKGGFIIEDLITRPKDTWMRIYTVFVSNEVFNTIQNNINYFIEHQKETFYSWRNLISYLFQVPMERDHAMICSQFVDRMLKLGHIDFTKRKSSLIAPKDMDVLANKSKSVYTVYKGEIAKYKPEIVLRKVKSLMGHARAFTGHLSESYLGRAGKVIIRDKDAVTDFYMRYQPQMNRYLKRIYESLILPCSEAKEIPLRIDGNGDIFFRNLAQNSFDAEYANSHKLLKEYEKDNNIEGMKTELCKLWSMSLKIEKMLYGPHSIKSDKRRALYNSRAHILQDFKKYLKIVQKAEGGFDFRKYYDESPYSNGEYKVSGTTVNGVVKIAKSILQ